MLNKSDKPFDDDAYTSNVWVQVKMKIKKTTKVTTKVVSNTNGDGINKTEVRRVLRKF